MSGPGPDGFNLATVFGAVAGAVPDQEVLVWRDRRITYAEMDARIDGIARFFVDRGLGVRAERSELANHESAKTTKLYDRRDDQLSLDEVERINI